MERTNPATGEDLEPVPEHDEKQVEARLAQAAETFETWRERPMAERTALLEAAADRLRSRKR
jgi:succinate-semialdehyde dehydrogenase/glutarate-semialdehyde dehydrogenase